MGVFVDYLSSRFSNLKNDETTILTADTFTLLVTSLRVTNRTKDKILINLKNVRNDGTITTTYENNEFEVEPSKTRDLVKEIGSSFHLQYNNTPNISESLKIFSNGYTQKFDCNISYMKLNDTPPMQ